MPVFSPSEAQQLLNNLKAHGGSAKFVSHENEQPARKAKEPNKTEAEFARTYLHWWRRDGIISDYTFEAIKLRISGNCYYSPDFSAFDQNGRLHCYEVKGAHIWDDSKVKFKAAKEKYPLVTFEMWQKLRGEWTRLL